MLKKDVIVGTIPELSAVTTAIREVLVALLEDSAPPLDRLEVIFHYQVGRGFPSKFDPVLQELRLIRSRVEHPPDDAESWAELGEALRDTMRDFGLAVLDEDDPRRSRQADYI